MTPTLCPRPHAYRGGWPCLEGPSVEPYWTGKDAKQSAIDYAKARAKFGPGEIRVLMEGGSIQRYYGSTGAAKITTDGFGII
jgi:hypothetical protein